MGAIFEDFGDARLEVDGEAPLVLHQRVARVLLLVYPVLPRLADDGANDVQSPAAGKPMQVSIVRKVPAHVLVLEALLENDL